MYSITSRKGANSLVICYCGDNLYEGCSLLYLQTMQSSLFLIGLECLYVGERVPKLANPRIFDEESSLLSFFMH